MDFSFRAIHDVVHPTAAFSGLHGVEDEQYVFEVEESLASGGGDDHGHDHSDYSDDRSDNSSRKSWEASQLNPKNRIDSLRPLAHPLWRLDGSTGFGTQFYAIPLFLTNPSPMRVDVFIHEGALYPPVLRRLLDLDRAFCIKDAARMRRLGIAQHILRILQWHTAHPDGALHPDVVAGYYQRGPFGSRIVIDHLDCHVHNSRVHMYHNYPLEEDLLPYRELLSMWGLSETGAGAGAEAGAFLPPEVDIQNVILVRQLHDSVCEVHIRGDAEYETQLIILKSLNSSVKYMYHELRTLLRDVPAHAHVIGRPRHVISKSCIFGGKRGVVGFTIPYHELGTLRDILPVLALHGRLALADQLRWACQLAQAMCHIWYRGRCYYPDLRLDNIVLSGSRAAEGDIVVIDFEQRGVWSSFSAPEVDFVENLRILARDDPDVATANPDHVIPEENCEHAKRELASCWAVTAAAEAAEAAAAAAAAKTDADAKTETHPPPDLADLSTVAASIAHLEDDSRYTNPAHGYNVAWICLTRREQEAAMVYMLGRVLWCIFEGMSAPHRDAVWLSYRWEPTAVEFPNYVHTPPAVQALIARCLGEGGTREQNQFVQRAGKIYMKEASAEEPSGYRLVADNLIGRARAFWQTQLDKGANWLQERNQRLRDRVAAGNDHESADGDGNGDSEGGTAYGRPTLQQVSEWLGELQAQLS